MSWIFISVKLIMILKSLFSIKKIHSFKIKKDYQYFDKTYHLNISVHEKDMLVTDIMKMKFLLSDNIHSLKYLAKYGVDKDRHGFYSLFGLGNSLISVQNRFLTHNLNFCEGINLFIFLKDKDIELNLLHKILMEEIPSIEVKNGIVKYYKNFNYYEINTPELLTELLNKNIFEIIKSLYQDNRDRFYKNLIKKLLTELFDFIQKRYNNDMFLYKNVFLDEKNKCIVEVDYSMILSFHFRPKLYLGVSVIHRPYVYVQLNDVKYIKTLFVLLKVVGDDMKLSVYEYYLKNRYKLLLEIDLKNTEYYKNTFSEIKSHFDYVKNEKLSLISYYQK